MGESSIMPPVMAVDGGGTRCRAAFDDGRSVTVVETGSANVSTDFDAALAQVMNALRALVARGAVAADDLARIPAFVGLAGVTGPAIADRLRAALPFVRSRVADDRPAALRGALGAGDGVIAHCGTGSFFAAQAGGVARLVGGWGPVLGDEASAQWTGRHALRIALDCADGLYPPSPMSERLMSDHGGSAGIVRFAGTATPVEFGAVAPTVTAFAARGDGLALRVMRAGADEIARMVAELGWAPGMTICLTGGIGPHFQPFLPAPMQADIAPARGEPLDGALALARDLAQESDHESG